MNSAKRRILLTGASGTLGRNFLEQEGASPAGLLPSLACYEAINFSRLIVHLFLQARW